jgi:trehalose 6-phosphate synthase
VTQAQQADLVIVANRLPVDRVHQPDGSVSWRRSPGGLVTALEPVLRSNDGAWIGWPGSPDEEDVDPFVEDGLSLVPVSLSAQEVEEFY